MKSAGTLGSMKDPRAVELLIEALAKEEDAAVREAISKALKDITGRDFGQNPNRWMGWWEKSKAIYLNDQ